MKAEATPMPAATQFLVHTLGLFASLVLCLAGVMLPWSVRNRCLSTVAMVAKRVLQSDTVVEFLTTTAFNTEEVSTIMRSHYGPSHAENDGMEECATRKK